MPLSTPLEALNVFVDFFGRTPAGVTNKLRVGIGGHQEFPYSRVEQENASNVDPEFIGTPWFAAPPRTTSPKGKRRFHEGPLEEGPRVDGSSVFKCGFCVPNLFVLTHAHSDHLRGLRPSWGRDNDESPVTSKGPSAGPRGPIVCTEITRQLLLRTHPKLEHYLLPLKLQTPYLFHVQTASVEAPVGHLTGPSGTTHPSGQHTPEGPSLLHLKAEKATDGESRGPVYAPNEAIQPKEAKELQAAHAENSSSKNSFRAWQQTRPFLAGPSQLLVERAAAAALRNSGSSPGGTSVCCCGRAVDRVYIQLVDARHCPGSALLLLRSPAVGSYVHTGDFCCSGSNLQPLLEQVKQGLQVLQQLEDPAAASAAAAVATVEQAGDGVSIGPNAAEGAETPESLVSQEQQRQLHVDMLYLDSTYLHPRFSFLSQEEAVANMSLHVREALKRSRSNALTICARGLPEDPSGVRNVQTGGLGTTPPSSLHVAVGVDTLGKESILQQLGAALNVPIGLSETHFDSAAAGAAASGGHSDCCTYSLEAFTRGFCCPVVRKAVNYQVPANSRHTSSSTKDCRSHREMPTCGCPWSEEASTRSPSCMHYQQQDELQQQQQQLNQGGTEELSGQGRAASHAAAVADVCLFAVPRRQLVRVVEALDSSGLPALGLLPSGGGFSFGALPSVHSVPISSHSSFSSILEFVKALSPQKVVLLEPLPVPSCTCATLRRPGANQIHQARDLTSSSETSNKRSNGSCGDGLHQSHNYEMKGSMAGAPESRDMCKLQRSEHGGALDEPFALLLDDPEALDTILPVRSNGLECMGTSSCSGSVALPALGNGCATSAAAGGARAAPSGLAARIGSCRVYGNFKYNGIEGLSAFVRATEVPVVMLGSGRRHFCPHGGPCRGKGDILPATEPVCGQRGDRSSVSVGLLQPVRQKRAAPSLPSMCIRQPRVPQSSLESRDAGTNSASEGVLMPLKKDIGARFQCTHSADVAEAEMLVGHLEDSRFPTWQARANAGTGGRWSGTVASWC